MENKWFGMNDSSNEDPIKVYAKKVEINRAKLSNQFEDVTHMVFGIITELGELLDIFKKYMAYGKPVDWVNVKEEMGDIMWYFIGLCNVLELDFWDILDTNMRKLDTRYKNGFTKEEAHNRDLKSERVVLEGKSKLEILTEVNPSGWMEEHNK
jgi:NTP pyrophosphatase (non-canonical NTP hydrolase)